MVFPGKGMIYRANLRLCRDLNTKSNQANLNTLYQYLRQSIEEMMNAIVSLDKETIRQSIEAKMNAIVSMDKEKIRLSIEVTMNAGKVREINQNEVRGLNES